MKTEMIARDTVQITCSVKECVLLRQALISFQYDNENYMKMSKNNPMMQHTFNNSKENTEEAAELLRQLHW